MQKRPAAEQPEWYNQLAHLRLGLDQARIDRLEAFRQEIACPHEPFALRIAGSAWAIRVTLGHCWNMLRVENAREPESDTVKRLYEQRRTLAAMSGQRYPPLPATCATLEGLMAFAVAFEGQLAGPDPFGWGKRIDGLLQPGRG